MKFSMIFEAQMTDTRDEHQVINDCLDQAVYAEQMGFDRIWSVEHHALANYAHMSASEIFLSFVAARTERIRIGHGVVCLPFQFSHPIRVAERTAMLDLLSDGRLDVGGGRGATTTEMGLYGVDVEKTYLEMEESFRIIAHAWTNKELEWESDLMSIHPPEGRILHVVPKPLQKPHPPLFMACTHLETLRMAADWGVGALVLGFGGPDDMRKLHDHYHEAIAARTGDLLVSPGVTNDHFSALCPTIVLDDREQAIVTGLRGQRFFAESIAHYYGAGPIPTGVIDENADDREEMQKAAGTLEAWLHEMNIPVSQAALNNFNPDQAYGTAEDAINYVQSLEEIGVDEVMCLIQMGTVPNDICMETIRQWGEIVIPHFRGDRSSAASVEAPAV